MTDFKKLPYTTSMKELFLIDGEFFKGSYYAFDLISTEPLVSIRMDNIRRILDKCKIYGNNFKTRIRVKDYLYGNLYNSLVSLRDTLDDRYEDGIIVIKAKPDYFNSFPLKWKKTEKLTIDFLIKKKDNIFSFYVQGPKSLLLFHKNEVSEKDYARYNNGDIVECQYKEGKWMPLHVRVDKKKPNFKTVAEDNMKAIMNPFDFEKVKEHSSRSKAVFYNLRRFHNYIKRFTLESLSKNKERLLDLASGKGGDFGKYRDIGIKFVSAYEIDKTSIEISKSRIVDILDDKKNSMNIEVNYMDLNNSKPPVPVKKFDVIVCNFAFHYFFNKIEHFISILDENSKKGTNVILTFFDNKRIIEHDNINSKIIKIGEDEIDVYIKDSVLNKPTREHIVDKDKLISLMNKQGFNVVSEKNFSEY
jgi:SAM-dependent methyltransferase